MIAKIDRPPLRVGMVGAGMVSRHHLIGWSRTLDADVVAICDPRIAQARDRADEFGIPATYERLDDMLDASACDVVDIVAPMDVHGPIALAAAARGIDVICQKPLAPSAAEARALVDEIGDRVRLVVHENWRFRPAYRQIKEWMDAGLVGSLGAFVMTHIGSGLSDVAGGTPSGLVRQPFFANLDRLLVWETLIHHLDTLWFLLGPMRLASARIGRLSTAVKGEDTAVISLDAATCSGVLVACTAAAGTPPRATDTFVLWGRSGTLSFNGVHVTAQRVFGTDTAPYVEPTIAYQTSYDRAIAHYAHCLRTGTSFESRPADHLAILDLAEEIYAREPA